ncbi:MAG: hypothetical protein QM709_09590 [Spongiibacteraceae bacterium]
MIRAVSAVLFSLLVSTSAFSATIQQTVDGHDNLFYTDWGHWFTLPSDHGLAEPGSQAASAIPFNFAGYGSISITATGLVTEDVYATYTPDGVCVSQCDTAIFPGTELRASGLPVYALIGIWSSSATEIVPFYTENHGWANINSGLGLLLIGSSRDLVVPTASSAYLFLAVNDGGFADNSGAFNVTVEAVPVPGALLLMGSALMALVGARRRAA